MGGWPRDTPWRQGHILPIEATRMLEMGERNCSDDKLAIVISHDCDIAQNETVEPLVEVIIGRKIASTDGNFSHSKSARRLHLTITGGVDHIAIDLLAGNKRAISKEKLAEYHPEAELQLTLAERTILQRWLAARYRRAAFPDEFDQRLSDTGLRDRLGKILKLTGEKISAIYFDLDDGDEISRTDVNEPYKISIYLLYSTESDPEDAEAAAKKASKAITQAFVEKCRSKQGDRWHNFELIACEPLSDQAMTIRQAEYLKRWSADHISLRPNNPQAILREE